ncbi:MAG: 3-deoxy-8-phosphooctulonate synthase [Ignavibacteriales bacterium]|nr:3-deoxy-8-phosphooctulonate synthase [Ignavibacteriales bacterium]
MVTLNNITIGERNPLVLIAGPCVVENRDMILITADKILSVAKKFSLPVIFKSSYKKANRTSGKSFTGIGMDEALHILSELKKEFSIPILTDVHTEEEVKLAATVADVLQIPAFLCRQTDLLFAAGKTGKVVNIKKGQFLSPYDMKFSAEKVEMVGNKNILLTERGTTFGYNNLVVDMRSLVIMRQLGYPVIFDATHSVQIPGTGEGKTSGNREFILPLARAAVAVGVDGIFLETHPNPKEAKSDAESQLPLSELENLVEEIVKLNEVRKKTGKEQ